VFERADFTDVEIYNQIGRALGALVESEEFMKIGYGLYIKSMINEYTGYVMPVCPISRVGVLVCALEKLNF
jgi:hypothetical protein